MTGFLNPKSSEIVLFSRDFRRVPRGYGSFHPAAVLFFSKSVIAVEVLSSQIEG